MKILVIDGQGGRLGRSLIEGIRARCPDAEITAVGTNSIATRNMLTANVADHLATGENAVIVACRSAHVIAGPIGIIMADALLGETTPAMAAAVASSAAARVLVPMNLCDTYVAGVDKSASEIIEDALEHIRSLAEV